MLKDVIKDCKDNYFHTFEYRCEYDLKFEHKKSGEVFHFTKNLNFKLFLSQSERLFKENDEYQKDGYNFRKTKEINSKD